MRKWIRKCSAVLAAALVLSLVVPAIVPAASVTKVEAAEVKLSDKKVKLEVGETYQLELEGTESEAKWKSKKNKVASVDQDGVITAKKVGKTNIIVTVDGQKYKCKVTVVRAENPYVAEAPFEAVEYYNKDAGYSIAAPKGWKNMTVEGGNAFVPNEESESGITVALVVNEETKAEYYDLYKEFMKAIYTEETLNEALAGEAVVDENGVQFRELETENGKVIVMEVGFDNPEGNEHMVMVVYALYMDGMGYEIDVMDCGDYEGEMTLAEIAEYMIQSFQYYK